jgi:hypothetical protein
MHCATLLFFLFVGTSFTSSFAAFSYCGTTIDDAKLPPNTLLFYEHDEGYINKV